MRQTQLLMSRTRNALRLSRFSLLIHSAGTVAQSQQISEMGANSDFRRDVRALVVKESLLCASPRQCCHQLIPRNPDRALRSCWTLREERLEANQAYHMLARYLSQKI